LAHVAESTRVPAVGRTKLKVRHAANTARQRKTNQYSSKADRLYFFDQIRMRPIQKFSRHIRKTATQAAILI
jgi:hypothetical protein